MRKILITSGMCDDYMIILTDAPKYMIEKWCCHYNWEKENGKNTYFELLNRDYSVKVLADSQIHSFDRQEIEAIGYAESYDLSDYPAAEWGQPFTGLKKTDFRTICFCYKGSDNFEIVYTDAPNSALALHVAYKNTCHKENLVPRDDYFPIQEMGYQINLIGTNADLDKEEVAFAVIDASFEYEWKPVDTFGNLVGVFEQHGTDDFGLWEGFLLSKEDEQKIWSILSAYDTQGCSVRGTLEDIREELKPAR